MAESAAEEQDSQERPLVNGLQTSAHPVGEGDSWDFTSL